MTVTTCTEEADAMSNDTISLQRQENNTSGSSSQLRNNHGFLVCLHGQLPFSSWPEQVGPQDDGDVRGRHLVYGFLLR